jgi:adenylate cyclase
VVEVLIEDPDLMVLGGEERELSILFSDLAGFTSFSEGLTPTELVTLLNEYLSEMTDFVLANDGIIDKFEGDLIMAEFGAPLHARIGLNTGRVVLGNLGSRDLQDYTVLGDAVNLASRLEGANKGYGTSIAISEATFAQAESGIIARELDWLQVKGKAKAVTIYELLALKSEGLDEATEGAVAEYSAALTAYRAQDWDEAEARFTAAIARRGEDPPSAILLDRVKYYRDNPPGEDWNGVFVMTAK